MQVDHLHSKPDTAGENQVAVEWPGFTKAIPELVLKMLDPALVYHDHAKLEF